MKLRDNVRKQTKNTKTPETNLETHVKGTTIARISVLELRLVDANRGGTAPSGRSKHAYAAAELEICPGPSATWPRNLGAALAPARRRCGPRLIASLRPGELSNVLSDLKQAPLRHVHIQACF